MPRFPSRLLRRSILAVLLAGVLLCRLLPAWGEGYALHLYPTVSAFLSACASPFPFSLEEIVVGGFVLFLVLYPILAFRWKQKPRKVWLREAEVAVWIYVWFYLGWGANYYRQPFFVRAQAEPVAYEEAAFRQFLSAYTDSLNLYFCQPPAFRMPVVESSIKSFFGQLPEAYGLARPKAYQHPKRVLFNPLYSGIGVLGYMGPFFAESQLNADLLPVQLPFTYAHELSHLLGVSSEAEANFWAYQACIHSPDPEIRYCGYFGLLPYVVANARLLLDENLYREWAARLRPEVVEQFTAKSQYWESRYSPLVGSVQDRLYDWFLKGNRIGSGRKNYAEVIQMLMAWEAASRPLS